MIPVLFTLAVPVFYIIGVVCRDGNFDPGKPFWQGMGHILIGLSYFMFALLLVVAAVSGGMLQ